MFKRVDHIADSIKTFFHREGVCVMDSTRKSATRFAAARSENPPDQ